MTPNRRANGGGPRETRAAVRSSEAKAAGLRRATAPADEPDLEQMVESSDDSDDFLMDRSDLP